MIDRVSETAAGEMLELVRTGQATTRSDLRRLTGMSRTAVVARVSALAEAGLLLLGEELASTGGRPPGGLVFNVDAGVVLAVAIGRSRTQLAVFDLAGTELGDGVRRPRGRGRARRGDAAGRRPAGGSSTRTDRPVLGVGISLPGTVDPERAREPGLAGDGGLGRRRPRAVLRRASPMRRSTSATTRTSSRCPSGSATRRRTTTCSWSRPRPGLGLGIVADGQVVGGHLGGAGEIGHTKVDAAAGRPCRCGATGCLETIAGGWALVAQLAEAGRPVAPRPRAGRACPGRRRRGPGLLRESGRQRRRGARGRHQPAQPAGRRRSAATWPRPSTSTPPACARASTPVHRPGHPRPPVPALDVRRPGRAGRVCRDGARPGPGPAGDRRSSGPAHGRRAERHDPRPVGA